MECSRSSLRLAQRFGGLHLTWSRNTPLLERPPGQSENTVWAQHLTPEPPKNQQSGRRFCCPGAYWNVILALCVCLLAPVFTSGCAGAQLLGAPPASGGPAAPSPAGEAPGHRASAAAALGSRPQLGGCGPRPQLLRSRADLLGPGSEPTSPALADRFFTTGPPGKGIRNSRGHLSVDVPVTTAQGIWAARRPLQAPYEMRICPGDAKTLAWPPFSGQQWIF